MTYTVMVGLPHVSRLLQIGSRIWTSKGRKRFVLMIDLAPPIGDREANDQNRAGVTMSVVKLAVAGVLAAAFALLTAGAEAQTAPQGTRVAQGLTSDDLAARPGQAERPMSSLARHAYPA